MNSIKERTIEFVKFKGITMKSFETKCGLSSGYVTSMRKGFGSDKLNNILTAFPELNRDWLLYGEGDMLKNGVAQTSHGDNSPNVLGDGNQVNTSLMIDKVLDEFAEQRRLTEKAQDEVSEMRKLLEKAIQNNKEQADRFFAIIERMQGL